MLFLYGMISGIPVSCLDLRYTFLHFTISGIPVISQSYDLRYTCNFCLTIPGLPGISPFEDPRYTCHFYPTALKGCWGIVFTHGVRMGRWSGRWAAGGKKFVWAVSQKPKGVGSSYLVGTLVRMCRCCNVMV